MPPLSSAPMALGKKLSRPSGTRCLFLCPTQDWVRQTSPNHPGLNSGPSLRDSEAEKSEKRKAKSEKRKAKSEKRKAKSEKRKAKSEKQVPRLRSVTVGAEWSGLGWAKGKSSVVPPGLK